MNGYEKEKDTKILKKAASELMVMMNGKKGRTKLQQGGVEPN